MQYRVVYDLIDAGFPLWPQVCGVIVLLLVSFVNIWRRQRRGKRTRVARGFVMMAVVVALVVGAIPAWDFHRLSGLLARGETMVVEGVVNDYLVETTRTRVAESGKNAGWQLRASTRERFRIGDTAFEYDRDMTRVGFPNGGDPPIQIGDGMPMRIHYVVDRLANQHAKRILRVEVAETP